MAAYVCSSNVSKIIAVASSSIFAIVITSKLFNFPWMFGLSTSSTEEKTEEQPNEDDKKDDKGADIDEEEIMPTTPSVTLGDVIGCDNIKEDVKPYVEFLKNRETFLNLGGNVTKGCLLVGPKGSGKTLIARAIAGTAKVPLFEVSDSIQGALYCNGKRADKVEELFNIAKKHSPCVLFFDKLDIFYRMEPPLVREFLFEMDKCQIEQGILFVGAALELPGDDADKVMVLSNRFSTQVLISIPKFQGRKELFSFYLSKIKHDNSIDVDILARRTDGMYGGDMKELVNRSVIRASMRHGVSVTMRDLDDVIDTDSVGSELTSFLQDKESLKGTAYHEAGHALVSYYSNEEFLPLYKATIIARGHSLGHTLGLPEGSYKNMTKRRLLCIVDVCLGGRVAEELLGGKDSVTTGE